MNGSARSPSTSFDRACSRTRAAWERFASGGNEPSDVPLSIALSWQRCRDVYRIDPDGARPGTVTGDPPAGPVHGRVLAELGALASSLLAGDNRLVTVSDGAGTILAAWGTGPAGRRAPDVGLSPTIAWSEPVTGTNAIGTAIVQRRVCSVDGPEHWSTALHPWSCTGIALSDPLTATPLATLTVSSWQEIVTVRPIDLLLATEALARALQATATCRSQQVTDAFTDLERRTSGALVALDMSGRILAANFDAQKRGAVPGHYAHDRPRTSGHDIRSFGNVIPEVRDRTRHDPSWRGTVSVWSPLTADHETFRVVPVLAGTDAIGFLACTDTRTGWGEPIDRPVAPETAPRPLVRRVPALGSGGQIVMLHPIEIRYARADGHTVWLVTDQGSMRATVRGIDQVEQGLAGLGFLRVHRSYLVNAARIRDVTTTKDRLELSTAPGGNEQIPVSRRCVPSVRHALGL